MLPVKRKPRTRTHRQMAEAWKKDPEFKAAYDELETDFALLRELLAARRRAGLTPARALIKQRDLSSAYSYLQIAETFKGAGMRDRAIEWAERGVKAFPVRTDGRLREFLAGEYHRLKRHDEAMALIWAEFTESPALDRYRILKAHADRIGLWNPWREKALEYLRESIAKAKDGRKEDGWGRYVAADHSDFVRIFLWEKDHPEDVLPIYQRQLERTLNRKNNQAYREAVALLRKIRGLTVRIADETRFTRYLASVRATHKPKRNFMKLLDGEFEISR